MLLSTHFLKAVATESSIYLGIGPRLVSNRAWAVVVCFWVGLLFSSQIKANTIDEQRRLFEEAINALVTGQYETFKERTSQNTDYILYPYLQYYDLRERLASASEEEIARFINQYSDMPISWQLRNRWLFELAEQNRWETYHKYYTGQSNIKLKCYYLYAQLQVDKSKNTLKHVLDEAEQLWLSGDRRPQECKPVFEKLVEHDRITSKMLWERIELAMNKGNLSLAGELATPFNRRDKELVDLWQTVYKDPEKGLSMREMKRNHMVIRKIAEQAIRKIARRDADKATQLWGKAVRRYGFSSEQRLDMQRYIALQAAYDEHDNALNWLKAVPQKYQNDDVRIMQVRIALKNEDWQELIRGINNLQPNQKEKFQWRYWSARALEQLGNETMAMENYAQISSNTNYYGFLAADRIDQPYRFNSEPLQRDDTTLQALMRMPAVLRTRELFLLGRVSDARSEWNSVIRKLDADQLKVAALLVYEWEWYDNAIVTVAKTGHFADLELRFPTPFKDLVYMNAQTYGLDPSWIYGVTRRESAFNVYARSSAGALGLMQLMPSTARYQSKKLGLSRPSVSDILSTEQNLLLGSAYLNNMLTKFSGNLVLATAAYNAGPNRVLRWLPKDGYVPADVWVDTLPYKETREYVRAVMAYATIFDWKLKQQVTPLRERMRSITTPMSLADTVKNI
ncbi:transglycosylase SLT domain-containing protein [Kaarinaea lacus]